MTERSEFLRGFLTKHGLSWKAFAIALVLPPPTALLIAVKIPGISNAQRAMAVVAAIAVPAVIIFGGLGVAIELVKHFWN